jgi:hypothetical protein
MLCKKKRLECAAISSSLFSLRLSYTYSPSIYSSQAFHFTASRSLIILQRLLLLFFLLLLALLLLISLLRLEFLLPHLIRRLPIQIGEDDFKDFLVPLYGSAFDALFDILYFTLAPIHTSSSLGKMQGHIPQATQANHSYYHAGRSPSLPPPVSQPQSSPSTRQSSAPSP